MIEERFEMIGEKIRRWEHHYALTPERLALAQKIIAAVQSGEEVAQAIRRHPLPEGGHLAKSVLVAAYRYLVQQGSLTDDPGLLARLRMKPVRTLSGVTTVTVLTKPYPCPGKCIFCPTDVRMPKSYLPDEPGLSEPCRTNSILTVRYVHVCFPTRPTVTRRIRLNCSFWVAPGVPIVGIIKSGLSSAAWTR